MTTTDRATPAASALADIVRMRNAAQAECDAARTPLEQPYLRGSLAVWDEAVVTIAADGAAACRRMADIVEQAYADAPHMTYGHGAKQAARTIATILWRL